MPHPFQPTIDNVELRPSSAHGHGLFTTKAREKGEVLCVLGGRVLHHEDDLAKLAATEWNALDDDRILIRDDRTSYYYINHSRTPNLTIDPQTYELRTLRDIAVAEELTLDYLENGFPQAYLATEMCDYLR